MKSQRRHELQRNALEVEIIRFWEFLRRRASVLAWAALGVAAIVLGIVWYVSRSRGEVEQYQSQYARLMTVGSEEQRETGFEKIAAQKSLPLWAGNALVKLGDGVAAQLATQWLSLSEADRLALREKAQAYYDRAISEFSKEAVVVAMAHYGLGKLAEDWNDVEAAQNEYTKALEPGVEALRGEPIAYVVQDAVQRLGQFQGTVYMPASGPSSGPSTRESQPAMGSRPATEPRTSATSSTSDSNMTGQVGSTGGSVQPPRSAPAALPAESSKSGPSKSD